MKDVSRSLFVVVNSKFYHSKDENKAFDKIDSKVCQRLIDRIWRKVWN